MWKAGFLILESVQPWWGDSDNNANDANNNNHGSFGLDCPRGSRSLLNYIIQRINNKKIFLPYTVAKIDNLKNTLKKFVRKKPYLLIKGKLLDNKNTNYNVSCKNKKLSIENLRCFKTEQI